LRAIDVGFTDTEGTSILHVPDLHLVVAGDVVYGDVHQYLIRSEHEGQERGMDQGD
jgi:hypothetical protein